MALISPSNSRCCCWDPLGLHNRPATKSSTQEHYHQVFCFLGCPTAPAFILCPWYVNAQRLCLHITQRRHFFCRCVCVLALTSPCSSVHLEMSFNRSQGNSSETCFHDWQKLSHSGISGHTAPDKNGKCGVFSMRNAKLQKEIGLSYVKQMVQHEVNATVIQWESERLQDNKKKWFKCQRPGGAGLQKCLALREWFSSGTDSDASLRHLHLMSEWPWNTWLCLHPWTATLRHACSWLSHVCVTTAHGQRAVSTGPL